MRVKILYILKKDLDETGKKLFDKHKAAHEVTCVKLAEKSGAELVTLIETHDKLVMW